MSYVYFIKPIGEDGPIKIGFSSNPVARLATIHTSSPFRCEIAAKVYATQEAEAMLHHKFADARMNGEWFAPTPDLLDLVDHVAWATGLPGYRHEDCQPWDGYELLMPEFYEHVATEKARRQSELKRQLKKDH